MSESPAIVTELGESEPVRLDQVQTDGYHVLAETETVKDLDLCKEALDVLNTHYPGHFWAVKVMQGIIHVKNMSFSNQWGIARKLGQMEWDAMVFRREVMRAGGEYLERAKLLRGRWNGDQIQGLDGMTEKQVEKVLARQ